MLASFVSGGNVYIAAIVGDPNLHIRRLPTDGTVAFGRKTRTHIKAQIEVLAKVIDAFGFIVPVIVIENDKVLAGNARIEAARLLGLKTVPTAQISHLNAAQKQAFVIADNKLAELAGSRSRRSMPSCSAATAPMTARPIKYRRHLRRRSVRWAIPGLWAATASSAATPPTRRS